MGSCISSSPSIIQQMSHTETIISSHQTDITEMLGSNGLELMILHLQKGLEEKIEPKESKNEETKLSETKKKLESQANDKRKRILHQSVLNTIYFNTIKSYLEKNGCVAVVDLNKLFKAKVRPIILICYKKQSDDQTYVMKCFIHKKPNRINNCKVNYVKIEAYNGTHYNNTGDQLFIPFTITENYLADIIITGTQQKLNIPVSIEMKHYRYALIDIKINTMKKYNQLAVDVLTQIKHLHQNLHMIHRDISLENIVTDHNRYFLIDFDGALPMYETKMELVDDTSKYEYKNINFNGTRPWLNSALSNRAYFEKTQPYFINYLDDLETFGYVLMLICNTNILKWYNSTNQDKIIKLLCIDIKSCGPRNINAYKYVFYSKLKLFADINLYKIPDNIKCYFNLLKEHQTKFKSDDIYRGVTDPREIDYDSFINIFK
jgi:serine/threonine protein kinase